MNKLIVLALKEVRVTFRDPGGLLLMMLTPFLLTLAVVWAFGTEGNVNIQTVPVLLQNQDSGVLGQTLVETFQSPELAALVAPTVISDTASGQREVQLENAVALVTVPQTLTQRLTAADPAVTAPVTVSIYAAPTHQIGTVVVQAIVEQFLSRAALIAGTTQALAGELATRGLLQGPEDAAALSAAVQQQIEQAPADAGIGLEVRSTTGREFNWLNYFAPSLAILFLMFAATGGGRTLLVEKQEGTLPRLLVTPTPAWVILIGKMAGTVLTGLLQVGTLWVATMVVGAYWGPPSLVIPCVLLLVICTTGLGALIAAWSRSTAQANTISAMVVLASSALAGNFYPRMNLPEWVRWASLVSPNAWGLDLFTRLQAGAGLVEVLPLWGGLVVLTVVYYWIAIRGFQRQFA